MGYFLWYGHSSEFILFFFVGYVKRLGRKHQTVDIWSVTCAVTRGGNKKTVWFSPSPFSLGAAWLSDSAAASITLGSWSLRRRRERLRRSPSMRSASASSPSPSSREYGLLSGSLNTEDEDKIVKNSCWQYHSTGDCTDNSTVWWLNLLRLDETCVCIYL